ncbi:hypothetical protein BZG79_15050 [Salinivibrio sp. MA427]|uniref:hypothetical protein n=1 Tax=Salinivibrio sp. MA427 TaxID=1909455 RepID=UPI00098AE6B0|nr:hypothetical protein [Salinivibrio sp. MA427]OOF01756.1 hypothetical protein BZG79_15050 [Salinivibrio sp. MA427]
MAIRKKDLVVDAVFSISVPDHGYVLAQFRNDCRLDVFDCLRKEDLWGGIDLNTVPVLFNITVASHRLVKLFSQEVTDVVFINNRPQPILSLSLGEIRSSTKLQGLKLVKRGEVYDPNHSVTIIPFLTPEAHQDILYAFECLSMIGQPEIIRERIKNYYETGIDWDRQKSLLYPDLPLPPKDYQKMTCEEFMALREEYKK